MWQRVDESQHGRTKEEQDYLAVLRVFAQLMRLDNVVTSSNRVLDLLRHTYGFLIRAI